MEQILQSKIISNNNRLLAFIFLIAVLILLLIGLSIILPSSEIILQVRSEPFIGELPIKIDHSIKKPLYNLNTIPGSIFDLYKIQNKIDTNKYLVIDDLIDKQEEKILVFLRQDANNLLNYKLHNLTSVPKVTINQDIQLIDYKMEDINLKNGWAVITFFVQTKVIPDYDTKFLADFLTNKSQAEAVSYLKGLPNIQEIKINNWPGFLKKLPSLSRRIKIRVDII